ncbi:carbohydrate ABC transporter permease [Cellulosimicrobium cellulans]|uniref:carbohydrate ABC transporter permease n=1 Tax=Cellulosimicrobium cellulans TaxID=1710 RepID=UPI00130DABF3|nr:carbohydrate ABC transporter permease [Cellulosimicrobium cellulans]
MNRLAVERRVLAVARPALIVILLISAIFPFYYMVLLSFVPIEQLLRDPSRLWVPLGDLTLDTYRQVLLPRSAGGEGFGGFMGNSAVVSLVTAAVTLLVVIPGSYAVSRLRFTGRRHLSSLFLVVYMFPAIILAVPLFVAFSRLGIRESLVGLVIVYVALNIPVSIHMLRNYFDTIPVSIEEAARVDGATRLQTMRRITVPLAMPTIMSTLLYVFMIAWNEFLFALLFLTAKRDLWTVSLGLSQLSNGVEVAKTVLMAGSVLLTVPIVVLYSLAERKLTDGLAAGADKG